MQVPADVKVSIISIVGAFRTGKSFLLDLFLRYLRYHEKYADDAEHDKPEDADGKAAWLFSNDSLEGNANLNAPDFHAINDADDSSRTGFKWRPGRERQTTGIWLWSRPFMLPLPGGKPGEKIAVLLMDTQGMFDNRTGQMLTASIFGLSTLLSSYCVYNVKGLIGEDNLQHLALFTEYARIVAQAQRDAEDAANADDDGAGSSSSSPEPDGGAGSEGSSGGGGAAAAHRRNASNASAGSGRPLKSARSVRSLDRESLMARMDTPVGSAVGAGAGSGGKSFFDDVPPPFQRLEFLVRDASLESEIRDVAALDKEMKGYLETVFNQVHLDDLKTIRQQIVTCFEEISCYMLPNPGMVVAEGKYDDNRPYEGAIMDIRDKFRVMLQRYTGVVFHQHLLPKKINGRDITGRELGPLIRAYCDLFKEVGIVGCRRASLEVDGDVVPALYSVTTHHARVVLCLPNRSSQGKGKFPEAGVLLQVTANINNRNAMERAKEVYLKSMDGVAGPGKPYLKEDELRSTERRMADRALATFDALANFGPAKDRRRARSELKEEMAALAERYVAENADREPWKTAQPIVFAIGFMVLLYVLRLVLDFTCSPWVEVCKRASNFASFVNTGIVLFLVYVAYTSGSVTYDKIRAVWMVAGQVASQHGISLPDLPVATTTAGPGVALPDTLGAAAPAPASARGSASAAGVDRTEPRGGGGSGPGSADLHDVDGDAAGGGHASVDSEGVRRRRRPAHA